jgi:hypothetical protein
MQINAGQRRGEAAILLAYALRIDHEQGRAVTSDQMLDRLSGERVLPRIKLHALADAQLQGIVAHAAGTLQPVENGSPFLFLGKTLHEYFHAADTIQGA